jgi:hypothetical protein
MRLGDTQLQAIEWYQGLSFVVVEESR